jgi:hypothetical protein
MPAALLRKLADLPENAPVQAELVRALEARQIACRRYMRDGGRVSIYVDVWHLAEARKLAARHAERG